MDGGAVRVDGGALRGDGGTLRGGGALRGDGGAVVTLCRWNRVQKDREEEMRR